MNDMDRRLPEVQMEGVATKMALGGWLRHPATPWWEAIGRRRQASVPASVVGAVVLMAQTNAARDEVQREALGRLMAEVIDDVCHATAPVSAWAELLASLDVLAEGYPEGSLLRDATEDLRRRVLRRRLEQAA